MKSTFLVAAVMGGVGVTKVILRDVNGGDGLNAFRAGSRKGDLPLDFYGDGPKPEPGKTYVLILEEYVEPVATDENSETASEAPTEAAPTSPLSIAFNALVTIAVDENGKPTLNIEATTEDAAPAETEETTDTKDDNGSGSNETTELDSNTDSENTSGASNDTNDISDSQSDTNTQGNAGPAAGANNSEAGTSNAANPDNVADNETDPVGGDAQVS